jgi:hypothetical protein
MAMIVRQKTRHAWHIYERNAAEFYSSQNVFRVIYMLDALHRQFGVRYNPARIDRSDEAFDPLDGADLFVHGILSDKRTGTCSSLPVFAVSIGRRFGYPLKLVKAPEHLFFRWDDGTERFNVEYNGFGGNIYPDEHYTTWPVQWTPRIRQADEHAQWLTSLCAQEEVECFLGFRYLALDAMQRWDEALAVLLAAERFNPRSKPLHVGLRDKLLERIASRDGLPRASALLAAQILAGADLRQLMRGMKGERFPMTPSANPFAIDPFKRRYMDPTTGRFTSLDAYAGDLTDPLSYNKYVYTQGDPVNGYDPTGQDDFSLDVGSPAVGGVADGAPAPGGWKAWMQWSYDLVNNNEHEFEVSGYSAKIEWAESEDIGVPFTSWGSGAFGSPWNDQSGNAHVGPNYVSTRVAIWGHDSCNTIALSSVSTDGGLMNAYVYLSPGKYCITWGIAWKRPPKPRPVLGSITLKK